MAQKFAERIILPYDIEFCTEEVIIFLSIDCLSDFCFINGECSDWVVKLNCVDYVTCDGLCVIVPFGQHYLFDEEEINIVSGNQAVIYYTFVNDDYSDDIKLYEVKHQDDSDDNFYYGFRLDSSVVFYRPLECLIQEVGTCSTPIVNWYNILNVKSREDGNLMRREDEKSMVSLFI